MSPIAIDSCCQKWPEISLLAKTLNFIDRHKMWYTKVVNTKYIYTLKGSCTHSCQGRSKMGFWWNIRRIRFIQSNYIDNDKVFILQCWNGLSIWEGCQEESTSTPKFFDLLFLIRAYWNPKSRQGPTKPCLPTLPWQPWQVRLVVKTTSIQPHYMVSIWNT